MKLTTEELQQKINALQESNDEETHPQFANGKLLLNATETNKKYVMERGKKRQIMDGDTQKVLIQLNGGRADTSFQEVAIQLPPSIINGVKSDVPCSRLINISSNDSPDIFSNKLVVQTLIILITTQITVTPDFCNITPNLDPQCFCEF